ncbi:MAG: hypothetical protein AAGC60_08690 [Acidobacteriota bacterium]
MSRLRRLGLRLLAGLLVLVAVGGLGLWLARDQPRRLLEARIADAIDGEAQLGDLELIDTHEVRLHDLRLLGSALLPALEQASIETIEVRGSLEALRAGQLESVRLHGVELTLRAVEAFPDRPDATPTGSPFAIERIDLPTAQIVLHLAHAAQDSERLVGTVTAAARLHLEQGATLPTGEVTLEAGALRLDALAALAGVPIEPELAASTATSRVTLTDDAIEVTGHAARLEATSMNATIDALRFDARLVDRADLALEASATSLRLDSDTCCPLVVAQPSLTGTGRLAGDDGAFGFAADLTAPSWRTGRLTVGSVAGGAPRLQVDDVDLAAIVEPREPLAVTAGVAPFTGRADITVIVGDDLDYAIDLRPVRLALAEGSPLRFADGTHIELRGLLSLSPDGSLRAELAGPLSARLTLPGLTEDLGAAQNDGTMATLPPQLWPLEASADGTLVVGTAARFDGRLETRTGTLGRIEAEGTASLETVEGSWRWRGPSVETLLDLLEAGVLDAPVLPAGWRLEGRVEGDGRLRGPLDAPTLTASLRLDNARLTLPTLETRPLELTARGSLRVGTGTPTEALRVDHFDAALGDLGRLTVGPRDRHAASWLMAPVHLDGVAVAPWQNWLRDHLPSALVDATLQGTLNAEGRLGIDLQAAERTLEANGEPTSLRRRWRLDGPLRLAAVGYASADGARVVEGLDLTLDVAAAGLGNEFELEAHGQSGGFLLLWQTVFADLTQAAASWTLRGTRRAGTLDASVETTLERGPRFALSLADLESPRWRYALNLDDDDLATTREAWLAPVLAEAAPERLAGSLKLALEGWFDALDPLDSASASSTPDLRADGNLRLEEFSVTRGGLEVDALCLELPLAVARRGGAFGPPREDPATGPPRDDRGQLAYERIALGGLALPRFASPLWSDGDAVGLAAAVELPLAGGTVRLRDVAARHLLRPDRRLEAAVALDGLELDRLARQAGLPELEGRLDGELPRIRLAGDRLEVDGGGVLQLFGGEVRVRDISGSELTSPYPRLRLAADIVDLDLGRITRRIDFGEITGIVQGRVDGLELFGSVPVAFDAELHSVERPGVEQTVDVKAVQNLTILGTGARPTVFDRGLRRLFDSYRYAELGLAARLDSDVLTLRGLAGRTDGGGEYFLRGRLPFAINIVNASPGQTVSFQAMVRRLQTIDLSAARTDAASPPPGTLRPDERSTDLGTPP